MTSSTPTTNALSVIALEYDSSDTDVEESSTEINVLYQKKRDTKETPPSLAEYRTNSETNSCGKVDDSEEESSSSSDSESTEELDDSDDDSDQASDIENNVEKSKNGNEKSKGKEKWEFDDLPPIENLQISVPEVICEIFGQVAWIVDYMVIVQPKPDKPTLNLDTILFVERGRRVLGRILDVFGQVKDPHYCIRFNNLKHLEESNIQVGMPVYFCPNTEYTSLIFLHEITKTKACDPIGDDEVPDFSDDEEEQAYYRNLKKQQNGENSNSGNDLPIKKRRMIKSRLDGKRSSFSRTNWESPHPWNKNSRMPSNFQTGQYSQRSTQENHWPQLSQMLNPVWPMYYSSQTYGIRNFRYPMPFHPPRFSTPVQWNPMNQSRVSEDLSDSSSIVNMNSSSLRPLSPPPPPSSSPPTGSEEK